MTCGFKIISAVAFIGLHLSNGIRATKREGKPARTGAGYFWSSGRGSFGSYGASPYTAVFNVTQPSWTWINDFKWSTIPIGTSIDDKKDIYVTSTDAIRKFSPDGVLLWTWNASPGEGGYMSKAVALMDGAAYGITRDGRAFAISMETGRDLWSTHVSENSDGNNGQVQANEGVVITAVDDRRTDFNPCCGTSNHRVVGLNGTDGRLLWSYEPTIPVWNFGCSFVGDGTFVFQDLEGKVYRNRVSDGTLVWKAGGTKDSWTDGQANLGPNGIVYGVSNLAPQEGNLVPQGGSVTAYRVSDGTKLWSRDVPTCPNSIPAVGHLYGHKGLSVVMPIGENDKAGAQIHVLALDAETGEVQWQFEGFTQTVSAGLGDANSVARFTRQASGIQMFTMPNSWGTPAIDGAGTAYVGGTTGHFVALRDVDGDGKVTGPEEVSTLSTDADFVGSSGPALAPGILAVANTNSLMVWRS